MAHSRAEGPPASEIGTGQLRRTVECCRGCEARVTAPPFVTDANSLSGSERRESVSCDTADPEFIQRLGERVCSHSVKRMDKKERQLENLRSGGTWGRQPWDYNLLDSMAFQQDGTGRLSVGYGQLVMGRAIFRYEVPRRGVLSLTFINAPENRRRTPAGLVPWSVDVVEAIELSFVLRAGDFSGDMDTGTESGPFRYALTWALDFDRAPYPAWLDLPPGFSVRENPTGPWQTRYGHGNSLMAPGSRHKSNVTGQEKGSADNL